MKTLAELNRHYEISESARAFAWLGLLVMRAPNLEAAARLADASSSVPDRVRAVFKGTVEPGSLADPGFAGSLAPFRNLSDGFVASLSSISIFDALLAGGMKKLPLRTRVSVATSAIVGSTAAEMSIRPISEFSLAPDELDVTTAMAIVVLSSEVLKHSSPGLADFLLGELRAAVAAATDAAFLSGIVLGETPLTSAGSGAAGALADIGALVAAIPTGAASRLFVVTNASDCKTLAFLPDTSGAPAFANMTPQGGEIGGVPILCTDQLPAGTMIAVDASGVGGNSDVVTVDKATSASLKMDSAPAQAPAALLSLFQANCVGLRATRYFGYVRLRTDAAAVLQGANYLGSGV